MKMNKIITAYAMAFALGCGTEQIPSKEFPRENTTIPKNPVDTDPKGTDNNGTTNQNLASKVFDKFTTDPEKPDSIYNNREQYGNLELRELATDDSLKYTGTGLLALYESPNENGAELQTNLYGDLETRLLTATNSDDRELNKTKLDGILKMFADEPATMVYFRKAEGHDNLERNYMLILTEERTVYSDVNSPRAQVGYLALVPTTYPTIERIKKEEDEDAFGP
jgi:hypothetical protein